MGLASSAYLTTLVATASTALSCVPQVDELRNAGASELQRRLSLEATLKQAATLFRKELANKSDEVSALQVCSMPETRWTARTLLGCHNL